MLFILLENRRFTLVFEKKLKKIAFFFVWGIVILKKMIIIYG